MKAKKSDDKELLDWLSGCSKIDRSGYEGGYAFEFLIMNDAPNSGGVADIRIALRSFEGVDGLRTQARQAMQIAKQFGGAVKC